MILDVLRLAGIVLLVAALPMMILGLTPLEAGVVALVGIGLNRVGAP